MSNKPKLLITAVCIVVAAVCIVSTGRSWLCVREIDGQRMEISSASSALEAHMRKQDDSKADAKKKQVEITQKAVDKAWEKMVNNNPALQSKRLAAFRAETSVSYGPFFQKLHLTQEQRNRLADALMQRQADKQDLNAILADAGLSPDKADSAWRKAKQESLDAFDDAVVSVLGEEGLAQLENYEQDMAMWDYAGRLASVAARSGIPISLQQADRLVALMSSATSTPKTGDTMDTAYKFPSRNIRMPKTEADWAAIDEQAKTFLSKEQMDMFRGVEIAPGRFSLQFRYELEQAYKDAGVDTAK